MLYFKNYYDHSKFNFAAIGRIILINFFLASNLNVPGCQAWLTASDGYNIFITLSSVLIGVIIVALAFCFLYHCWLRDLLFEYQSDHRDYQDQRYGYGGKGGAIPYNNSGTGGRYKKKPPPPPDYRRSESPSHRQQQEVGQRSSPTRHESAEEQYRSGIDDRYRPSGGQIYHTDVDDPNLATDGRYDRTTTVRVSPTLIRYGSGSGANRQIMSPSALGHQNEFDSSLESRRSPSPRRHLYTTTTTTVAGGPSIARPPPDYDPSLARSIPFSASRPGSGLSHHGVETTIVNYRSDGGGPQRASDSGTGASLNYQATYQQKVTTTRNKAAYFGSSV